MPTTRRRSRRCWVGCSSPEERVVRISPRGRSTPSHPAGPIARCVADTWGRRPSAASCDDGVAESRAARGRRAPGRRAGLHPLSGHVTGQIVRARGAWRAGSSTTTLKKEVAAESSSAAAMHSNSGRRSDCRQSLDQDEPFAVSATPRENMSTTRKACERLCGREAAAFRGLRAISASAESASCANKKKGPAARGPS